MANLPSNAPWHPKGQPFCWQPKAAFNVIEEGLETSEAATASLVYVALSRIASNEKSATFEKPIGYIAKLAYCGRSTAKRRLVDLQRLNLVKVEGRKAAGGYRNELNKYTILAVGAGGGVVHGEPGGGSRTNTNREPVIQEYKNTRSPQPLNQSSIISLERRKRELTDEITTLRSDMHYAHDKTPERIARLSVLKSQLSDVESKLQN